MSEDAQDYQTMFEQLYERFNARDVDTVLASLASDVDWPNGWEGGFLHGHEEVRDYWTRQWAEIDSVVNPTSIARLDDGRIEVLVDQVVRDRQGQLLDASQVRHVYRLRDGQIEHMEICS